MQPSLVLKLIKALDDSPFVATMITAVTTLPNHTIWGCLVLITEVNRAELRRRLLKRDPASAPSIVSNWTVVLEFADTDAKFRRIRGQQRFHQQY